MQTRSVPIPPPHNETFKGRIRHPSLWLWDSWTVEDNDEIYLFCLGLSKWDSEARPILPPDRNKHVFHIRKFQSCDRGRTWKDCGALLTAYENEGGEASRNIWSGSVHKFDANSYLYGYTGVRQMSENQPFIQSICVARGFSPAAISEPAKSALCCSLRDYDLIMDAGYYLGPKSALGSADGEEGGPILSWRDPFIFQHDDQVHAFWAAKTAPRTGAVAHAILDVSQSEVTLKKLLPPIVLPDAEKFTQAEVPKIFRLKSDLFALLISSCDRKYENQPDSEVAQDLRLYFASDPRGPWRAHNKEDSRLHGLNYLFGASMISFDLENSSLDLIGPYTENAGNELQLSFESRKTVAFTRADT